MSEGEEDKEGRVRERKEDEVAVEVIIERNDG